MHVSNLDNKAYVVQDGLKQKQLGKINSHVPSKVMTEAEKNKFAEIKNLQAEISELENKIQANRNKQNELRDRIFSLSASTEGKDEEAILKATRLQELPFINEKFLKEKQLYELKENLKLKSGVIGTKKIHFEDLDNIIKQQAHEFIKERVSHYAKNTPHLSNKGKYAYLNYAIIRIKIWNELEMFIKTNEVKDKINARKFYCDELNKQLYLR